VAEVTYQRETVQQVRAAGIEALLQLHWTEIADYPDIRLSPNWEVYMAVEDYGGLRAYTARVDEQLVGYACYFVKESPHYSDSLQAVQDVVFVHSAHRKGRVGINLLRYADEQLAAEGVQVVRQHVKVKHAQLGSVLEHLGYECVERIYSKRLDKGI
jgi:GNAT superfamily N-acetyltransferase